MGAGIVTTYGFNNDSDLTSRTYGDATPDVVHTHRRDGSAATVADAAGLTNYAYSGAIATGESVAGQGLLPGLTLSYPQTNGLRQSFTATLNGATVSAMGYGYDNQGRLDEVSEPGIDFAADFAYVPDSDLPFTTTSKRGGSTILTGTRTYDSADRLDSIGYARPGNLVVTSHDYTLDAADRKTRADREDGTAWVYGYDSRDEVTSAEKRLPGESPLAGWQQAFLYDNLGNRKWMREGGDANGANLRQTDYASNGLNQYTGITHPGALDVVGKAPTAVAVEVNDSPVARQGDYWYKELGGLPNALAAVWQPVSVDADGPGGADVDARRSGFRFVPPAQEVPFHDADGNLVADSRWSYVWNAENQLVEVTTAPMAAAAGVPRERYRYIYVSRHRRIARTVEGWDDGVGPGAWVLETSERFVYDDWNVVAVVNATGAVVQRYAWGNDLSGTPQGAGGVGGLLAAKDAASGRSWCYAYDGNGNVSAAVDLADGAKVGRYDYDAFGRTVATWGDEGLARVNPYRFSTKPMEGTGLYYYGFRYYQPETGRWLGRDPIEETGGSNLYNFTTNGGVNRIDRLGLDFHHWLIQDGQKRRGQALADSCTLKKCICDIDMYTTDIPGSQLDLDLGYNHWGGSPHMVLHSRLKYNKMYKLAARLTMGQPCKFYSTVRMMMEKYDAMLAAYGRDPGFDRGSYAGTGPALTYFQDPTFRTDHSWNLEAFKCCKNGVRDNSVYVRHIEKELIKMFEQEMLKRSLRPPRRQSWQQVFDPRNSYSEPPSDDTVLTVIVVASLLTPLPGDELMAGSVGIVRLSRVKSIQAASEGIFGPGKSTLLRNLPYRNNPIPIP